MKNKTCNNYFSKVALLSVAFLCYFSFGLNVNAQLSYGGRQIMDCGTEICNGAPEINVHFIIDGDDLISLYDSPATEEEGDSDVDLGSSQIGQYAPVPMTCFVEVDGASVPIWETDGTYINASTSVVRKDQFFAGAINPFVQRIHTNA